MVKSGLSYFVLENVLDKSEHILILNSKGEYIITVDSQVFYIEGEDKESYITSILAGFEETGFKLIGEL